MERSTPLLPFFSRKAPRRRTDLHPRPVRPRACYRVLMLAASPRAPPSANLRSHRWQLTPCPRSNTVMYNLLAACALCNTSSSDTGTTSLPDFPSWAAACNPPTYNDVPYHAAATAAHVPSWAFDPLTSHGTFDLQKALNRTSYLLACVFVRRHSTPHHPCSITAQVRMERHPDHRAHPRRAHPAHRRRRALGLPAPATPSPQTCSPARRLYR
ncbi:hypothetical protein DENSPDRAFT_410562 [Dentipellis sp. KUC8613]|nr:hypothetical protein DENSPDRAFT_410562 [Dentipellis sp. KUC8613]